MKNFGDVSMQVLQSLCNVEANVELHVIRERF